MKKLKNVEDTQEVLRAVAQLLTAETRYQIEHPSLSDQASALGVQAAQGVVAANLSPFVLAHKVITGVFSDWFDDVKTEGSNAFEELRKVGVKLSNIYTKVNEYVNASPIQQLYGASSSNPPRQGMARPLPYVPPNNQRLDYTRFTHGATKPWSRPNMMAGFYRGMNAFEYAVAGGMSNQEAALLGAASN